MTGRKAAIVTGSATGVGAATALGLALRGYDVLINYSLLAPAEPHETHRHARFTLGSQSCNVSCDAMTSHHAATIDRVLAAYTAVWSEPDAARREALLKSCWSEDSEIVGPGYAFKGTQAVLAEAARFQAQEPGARVVLTSGFDAHGRWARFTFALLGPDGGVANEGWDLVELAADGRIARVISFWGPLPPVATDLLPGRI